MKNILNISYLSHTKPAGWKFTWTMENNWNWGSGKSGLIHKMLVNFSQHRPSFLEAFLQGGSLMFLCVCSCMTPCSLWIPPVLIIRCIFCLFKPAKTTIIVAWTAVLCAEILSLSLSLYRHLIERDCWDTVHACFFFGRIRYFPCKTWTRCQTPLSSTWWIPLMVGPIWISMFDHVLWGNPLGNPQSW